LPFAELREKHWRLEDLLSAAHYDRDGNELESRGLYLDLVAWGYHAFRLV
jgi:hypothetical protein